MIVVKIGGSIAQRCPDLLDQLAERQDVVLVHGFGPQTTEACQARGLEPRRIVSPDGVTSRFTDEAVVQAMRGAASSVGQALSDALETRGCSVEHLGPEAPVFWGEVKPALRHATEDGRVLLVRGNRSGTVTDVEVTPVLAALARGQLPLVTPLALAGDGWISVDGDRAAAALAGAIEAEALVLLTDVPYVLDADQRPIDAMDPDGLAALLASGAARGGMVRKLVACQEALTAGVPRAIIGSGLAEHPLTRALLGQATEVAP